MSEAAEKSVSTFHAYMTQCKTRQSNWQSLAPAVHGAFKAQVPRNAVQVSPKAADLDLFSVELTHGIIEIRFGAGTVYPGTKHAEAGALLVLRPQLSGLIAVGWAGFLPYDMAASHHGQSELRFRLWLEPEAVLDVVPRLFEEFLREALLTHPGGMRSTDFADYLRQNS